MINLFSQLLFKKQECFSPKVICVYRPGNIGDIVCAIPGLKSIRAKYPDSKIILLSSSTNADMPGARDILVNAKWINEIWAYSMDQISGTINKISFLKILKKKRIDLWIELAVDGATSTMFLKHMLFIKIAGIKHAIGFRLDKEDKNTETIYMHETDRLVGLLKHYDISSDKVEFDLPILDSDKKNVSEIINDLFKGAKGNIVALNPGAKRLSNYWPKERFAEIAKKVVEKGYCVALLGSEKEKIMCMEIENISPLKIINLAGKLTVLQTAEFLKQCRMLVSNDTGTVHLSAAVNTPVVGLYSSWQKKGRWFPYGKSHQVIWKKVPCSLCYKKNCMDNICMKEISVNEVLKRMAYYF